MSAQPIRAVCFDLFHTLVDVGSVPAEVGQYTADILGLDRAAWNAACFGADHEIRAPSNHLEVIRRLAHSLDPSIPLSRIECAARERQRRFDHALCHVPRTTLRALEGLVERGLALALISNASTSEVSAWSRSPLAPLFQVAVFSWEVGYAKPDPQIYHRAVEGLGLAPQDCLFVGDGGSDEHVGARAVGMRSALIHHYLRADQRQMRRARVDYEVAGLEELLDLVEQLG